ncbi:TPA: hypothetical protein DCW54_01240 [Candidatus Dependentiae bacterium]|nr:hypothetical protein [Candidatus Dependentiae bacterium]
MKMKNFFWCLLALGFFVYVSAEDRVAGLESGAIEEVKPSQVADNKGVKNRSAKEIVRLLVKRFFDGFEWHVELPYIEKCSGGSAYKINASPAWLSYYGAVAKSLRSYVLIKTHKSPGVVGSEILHMPCLEDAKSSERIDALQKKFRAVLQEKNHKFAQKLRVFVGLSSYPRLAFTRPDTGIIFCDRDLWYQDEELVEIILLHELGHLVDPVVNHWLAETQALLPALTVTIVGFGALQLMHHKSIRGMVTHPFTASLGAALMAIESHLVGQPIWHHRAELYADTFAAEHTENPEAIAKFIEWLEQGEDDYRPFYYKIPGFDAIAKRFYQGYPSRVRRKENLQKIMERRLQEEACATK